MNCKFCNSRKIRKITEIESPYYKKKYSLFQCRECLSRFFNIKPNKIFLEHFYDFKSKEKANIEKKFEINRYWLIQKEIAIKLLGRKPKSVLDVGCCRGDFLMHFDIDVVKEGVELSKVNATIARERNLKIYNDFLEKLEFEHTYDIISAYAVFEHMIDPITFLHKIKSLLNNSGLLIILIPSFECLKAKLLQLFNIRWHMYSPPEHLNYFSRQFLDSFFLNVNLRIIKRYYTSGGLINPFAKVPLINTLFSTLMFYTDYSPINRIPIFDHMYSYYKNYTDE